MRTRIELSRAVSTTMGVGEHYDELRKSLVVNEEGVHPVITAMPTDTMDTIREAVLKQGGTANVIIEHPNDGRVLVGAFRIVQLDD